jgi:hypothetical protein
MAYTTEIENQFRRVKSLGFVESARTHDTGIGKTFEDLMGIAENNRIGPDFEDFEVKSHRRLSKSKVTLFTKSPSHPAAANTYIREKYGVPDILFPSVKQIHSSFYGHSFNTYKGKYKFKLDVQMAQKKVFIIVKDIKTDQLIPENIYWTFDDLETAFTTKFKSLFLVKAEHKKLNGKEYFHFTEAEVFLNPDFEKFISMLSNGLVMFDFRIGVYKTGKLRGKPHDHGSGFRFTGTDLPKLYESHFILS